MRCKKCQRTQRHSTKARCWREWFLCPVCAVEEHPEEYQKNQRTLWSKRFDMHGQIKKRSKKYAGIRNPPYKPEEREA
tara:strand:+ start:2866 stop:3099 length:234 start_codon:yes stop_codon:yes gene_type:complete